MGKYKDPDKKKRKGLKLLKEISTYLAWKTARENLEREIDLFWRRGLYFWTFIAAIFIARAASSGTFLFETPDRYGYGTFCTRFVSLCWTYACRGSKYWQKKLGSESWGMRKI